MASTNIVLFDTDSRGHHADYLTYLIAYHQANLDVSLVVVTDERLILTLQKQFANFTKNLTFDGIPATEIHQLHQESIFKRSYQEWRLFCRYAVKHQATQGLLMYFDVFQVGLLFGSKPPCSVAGIYFRPDFHYHTIGFKAKLNAFRKKGMLRLILGRKVIKTLFSLDKTAVGIIRSFASQTNVLPVSDPVQVYPANYGELTALRESLGLTAKRKTLLLFGFLDERKGVEKVFAAFKLMEKDVLAQIQLLLVGVIDPHYKQQIELEIQKLPASVSIKTVFEEIKGEKIQRYFEASDYVLALYQQHVGMSQIIIRAAISQKPLLASNFGLIGELVQTKSLGKTTDSADPEQIATLFRQAVVAEIPVDKKSMQQFAEENTDTAFAKTIFDTLIF